MHKKLILVLIGLILLLGGGTAGAGEKQDTDVIGKHDTKKVVSTKDREQNILCEKVSMLIKNQTINKYAIEYMIVPNEPRTDKYINLDIDGDGIPDKVFRSCGTGECGLDIALSDGGNIEFGTSPFFLIKISGKIYALVAQEQEYSKPSLKPIFLLYLINKKGVQEVCNTYEGR